MWYGSFLLKVPTSPSDALQKYWIYWRALGSEVKMGCSLWWLHWNKLNLFPTIVSCSLRLRMRSWLNRQKNLAWWQLSSFQLKLISFILSLRNPGLSYSIITPPTPHSPTPFSCIFGSNTNPQRPDCAYNPPWIDKPLISSLSPLPKDPGFEFFFLTSLWGSGFFPVEEPDPKLSSGDPSERAVPSWQDQKAPSSGNSAPSYMFRWQRRYETCFYVCVSLLFYSGGLLLYTCQSDMWLHTQMYIMLYKLVYFHSLVKVWCAEKMCEQVDVNRGTEPKREVDIF